MPVKIKERNVMQGKQMEWAEQWELFEDDELFLFRDWIYPNTLDDFRGKNVLECGCGGGQHTEFVASYAKSITAVDLNTIEIAVQIKIATKADGKSLVNLGSK